MNNEVTEVLPFHRSPVVDNKLQPICSSNLVEFAQITAHINILKMNPVGRPMMDMDGLGRRDFVAASFTSWQDQEELIGSIFPIFSASLWSPRIFDCKFKLVNGELWRMMISAAVKRSWLKNHKNRYWRSTIPHFWNCLEIIKISRYRYFSTVARNCNKLVEFS